MSVPVIGFIGFGEAAQCFARHLGVPGMPVFCEGATNRPPYSPTFRALVTEHGGHLTDSLDELVEEADIVFSAVVVATAAEVGRAISAVARPGTLVVDVNASSPSAKRRVAAACAVRGCSYVDANLMGAVSIYGSTVPLYISGDGATRFAEIFRPLGLSVEVAGPDPGTAAAVKM